MDVILNYINGELVAPESNLYLDNINPATGKVYSKVPSSASSDIEKAVECSKRAFVSWSKTSKEERSKYLLKISDLILSNIESLALAESIDNGKPLHVARLIDIPRAAENFKFFAEEILTFEGENFAESGKGKNKVHYYPLGVVGCISPWNLPLYLLSWKIAPALAAGCTVIAKPSEVTPMTAFLLSKICIEAGLPAGVLNIVHGLGQYVGEAINTHPDIKAISFTGSTATGRMIAKGSAETMKRLHLEMGGKNPTIVFADCDFDRTVNEVMRSAFSNQGQICLCGSRIFVERSIYDKFSKALAEKVKQLKVGNPLDSQSDQGSTVSLLHFNKVMKWLDIAKSENGEFLAGGYSVKLVGENSEGYFIAPTLIANLDFKCRTNQEEIFGPVATIIPFDSIEEVVSMANSTEYGLSGSVWSGDLNKAQKVAAQIDSGIIWINTWMLRDLRTPFGGMKESGRGREGGKYILEFFSNMKNICSI
ncbi:MAG: aldehyde dehydrogenase [Bacteriovorax sp.]|nr:aldehyde dehydrogenase [Bacteriovorax sp.]